jgi:hypothetical protein
MNIRLIIFNLFLISICILCFEIVATRVTSVIFVNNYAFIILSLTILGLSSGGIYSYYKIRSKGEKKLSRILSLTLFLLASSLILYCIAVTQFPFIENYIVYFFLLFLPFFFGGIFYSQIFKNYAALSFKVYAADLGGAAVGAIAAIAAVTLLGPTSTILILSFLIAGCALSITASRMRKRVLIAAYSILITAIAGLFTFGNPPMFDSIPIGNFPEKDFYHVYPYLNVRSEIMDSRWSIYGRSDLVRHSHQDMVRHIFIDGAAGSQMFRFNGDIENPDPVLKNLMYRFTSSLPFLFLSEHEKNSMLVIGPGGGKEVVTGLLSGVNEITAVEINPDFVNIVKDYSEFNGGIYTDFPNVNVVVQEGRQYVKRETKQYDLIVLVLPSTQQVQNIDNYALSENYLLTVESIIDYFRILTPEGRIILTVYNEWELKRLIATAMIALERTGINISSAIDHLKVIEDEFAPTLVIKKNTYSQYDVFHRLEVMQQIPEDFPTISFMPHRWDALSNSSVNRMLTDIYSERVPLRSIIANQPLDISPSYDNNPYFYKIERGIPDNFKWLFASVFTFGLFVVILPYRHLKKKATKNKKKGSNVTAVILIFFICLGTGFMIVEVTLFQKLVLYLGSPTVSLSILLSSLLIGMGTGSFIGSKIYMNNHQKRLSVISLLIVIAGIAVIFLYPPLLNKLLIFDLYIRAIATYLLLIPFGFLLGIPFPTCIQILRTRKMESLIPWMYGVNGAMSVLGSVSAVILSMTIGFTAAFIIGLLFYLAIFISTFIQPIPEDTNNASQSAY